MIAIFDYGAGNLRSVQNTLDELGAEYQVVRDDRQLQLASKIVLPGVGHFRQTMTALDALGVRGTLKDRLAAGVPYLGICLGLQILLDSSKEADGIRGLGLFPGTVRRFADDARVPHMGWNQLKPTAPATLLRGIGLDAHLYFAHSYYVPVMSATAATCEYTVPYTAVLESGNIFGVQFHPEKSGPVGLRIVKNFLDLAC